MGWLRGRMAMSLSRKQSAGKTGGGSSPPVAANLPFYGCVSVDKLRTVLDQALPSDVAAGLDSYRKYNRIMVKLGAHCGTTTKIAAAVFAALSPNNDYHGNLRDAHKLLAAHRKGTPYAEFTVSTYGQNKLKAWRIVNGEDPLALITANKTRSFFQNISDPEDVVPVTIDGHMLNMWRGRRENLVGLSFPTKLYAQVAEDARILAREHQMIPCQMQGVLWLTWRRLHGIRSTQQQELWDADLLAARLGFHAPNS